MKYFLLLALLAVFGASAYEDYAGYQVLRVQPETQEQVTFLMHLMETHNFLNDRVSNQIPNEIVVHESEVAHLQRQLQGLGLESEISIEDLKPKIDESMQWVREGKLDWENYASYQSIMDFLDEIESNTNGAELLTIGSSHEGRQLKVLHYNPGGSTKKVWIDGGIHAREWISPAVVTYVLNEITTNYAANQALVDKYDWYVIPLQNPDGYEYTRTNNRLWRKNRAPNSGSACIGVDLNRNWDFKWMEIGASSFPCSDIYAGEEPDSELETQAVRDYVLSFDEVFTIFLTLHSYSQVWLCPWGYTSTLPDDYADLEVVMAPAVGNITAVYGTRYRYGTSTLVLGAASGASDDWAKGVADIKHSYTIELRDTGFHGFELPPDQILDTAVETWEGMKVAIELANA